MCDTSVTPHAQGPGCGEGSLDGKELRYRIWSGREGVRDRLLIYLDYFTQRGLPVLHGVALTQRRNLRHDAAHDHLQLEMVPLRKLLEAAHHVAGKFATRSPRFFIAIACAKLGYMFASRLGAVHPISGIDHLLWGFMGIGAIQTMYKFTVWFIIYLCWKDIDDLQVRLNNGQLEEEDRYRLHSWLWDLVPWCAATLRPFIYYG